MAQVVCINQEEMAGKTIKSVVMGFGDEQMLLVFTDGSLIQFYASVYDEDGSIEHTSFLHPDDFRTNDLAEAIEDKHPEIIGIMRANEEKAAAENLKRKQEYERRELERLKAIYEKA